MIQATINDPESFLKTIKESDHVDYKLCLDDSKRSRGEFVKNVAGMANIGGGVLIFGIDEKKKILVGVASDERELYDQANLYNKIKDHLSPVPNIEKFDISYENKSFIFVQIKNYEDSPILITKLMSDEQNKQIIKEGDVYTRSGTQTILINKFELMNALLERVVTLRFQKDKNRILKLLAPNLIANEMMPSSLIEKTGIDESQKHLQFTDKTPRWEVLLLAKNPVYLPESHWQKSLGTNLELESMSFPTVDYSSSIQNFKYFRTKDGIAAFSSYGGGCWKSYWRNSDTGNFFWTSSLFEDLLVTLDESKKWENSVGIQATIKQLTLIFNFIFKYYLPLMPSHSQWYLKISLKSIEKRKLASENTFSPYFFMSPKTVMENEIIFERELTPENNDIANQICRDALSKIFTIFNWKEGAIGTNLDEAIINYSSKIQKTDISHLISHM